MKKKRNVGIETIKKRYGVAFVTPWIFGILVFVLKPMITSIIHSFSNVTVGHDGLETVFVGLKHYKYLLFEDPWYIDFLSSSVSGLFTKLPIIIALSLIFAKILNSDFKGRMIMRAVFFLPVIFASDVVMSVMRGDTTSASLTATLTDVGSSTVVFNEAMDFTEILSRLNLPAQINELFENYLHNTFNLIWSCGVQTLLFIAGLQTIPKQLYEVGKVEGATAWESFWYITIPMLSNVIMLVIFYTMIELFITNGLVVKRAVEVMSSGSGYDLSSAELWIYFVVVGLIMALVFAVYKLVTRKTVD